MGNSNFLDTLDIEFWAILASSVVALAVAGGVGKYIKPWIGIKPKLKVLAVKELIQGDKGIYPFNPKASYWRVVLKNIGNQVAEKVQADITNIIINGSEKENFIPIPLRWTHLKDDTTVRDILPGQTVYLDVGVYPFSENYMRLQSPVVSETDDLEKIKVDSNLVLTFYLKNGKSFVCNLGVDLKRKIIFLDN